jgi:hypothetical protein
MHYVLYYSRETNTISSRENPEDNIITDQFTNNKVKYNIYIGNAEQLYKRCSFTLMCV